LKFLKYGALRGMEISWTYRVRNYYKDSRRRGVSYKQ